MTEDKLSAKPPYAERHVRWCEREGNESRSEKLSFPDLLDWGGWEGGNYGNFGRDVTDVTDVIYGKNVKELLMSVWGGPRGHLPLRLLPGWGSYRGSELSEQSELLELSNDLTVYRVERAGDDLGEV